MKRICESLIESRNTFKKEKNKKDTTKQVQEKVRKEVNIKCLKCQNKIIQDCFTNIESNCHLKNLPNSHDSFSSLQEKDKKMDLRYNHLKPYETLYQSNDISLKYNYIFDKFI